MRSVKSVVGTVAVAVALSVGAAAPAQAKGFPEVIPLPNGFAPEGIASGKGSEFFAGSLANGAIFKGDFKSGQGAILAAGAPGRVSVGMKYDERSGYLFVAGGPTGVARVFDGNTGAEVAVYSLGAGFINDVVITRDAAFFTNSAAPVLFKLPLSARGGLPAQSDVQTLALSGDWQQVAGFNANGIAATPNGKTLIVVNSTSGNLFTVDPMTGAATKIDLGADTVTQGDGILLDGKTLYVVRNRSNVIAVVALKADLSKGAIERTITSPFFRVPTTIAEFGGALYAVNARFGTPATPATEYEAVRVSKR